jgi:hypothetical protein
LAQKFARAQDKQDEMIFMEKVNNNNIHEKTDSGQILTITQEKTNRIKVENNIYRPKLTIYGKLGEIKYLLVKCAAAKNNFLKLMIDCGADMNLINPNVIKNDVNFFPQRKTKLMGIAGSVESLGTVVLMLKFGRKNSPHEFQLVDRGLPNNIDGIIGKPLTDISAIDFQKGELIYHDEEYDKERLKDAIFDQNKMPQDNQQLNTKEIMESKKNSNEEVEKVIKFLQEVDKAEIKNYSIFKEDASARAEQKEREKRVLSSIDVSHLEAKQAESVQKIVVRYVKVFRFSNTAYS